MTVVLSRMLFTVARLRVTIGYALALVVVATTLLALGPQVQELVISRVSTNLHNLWHGHLATLIGSAFVTQDGPMWVWLPGLVSLLALAELLWRSARVILTFALGHVGATLIVAVGLTAAIRFGWLPISVAHVSDVGISYGATAVLGALTAAVPVRWRPAWIGWWLAVGLLVVSITHDFTNVGHFVGLLLGMLVSTRFASTARWTRARVALLAVGGAFGYLMLVNIVVTAVAAPLAGALGAVAAQWAARRYRERRSRRSIVSRSIVTGPELTPEPALYD